MQEKQFTMDDATKVWWFVGWRTGLTTVAISILIKLFVQPVMISANINLYGFEETVAILISFVFAIYYIKMAVNRDYKNFRLTSVDKIN